MVLKAEQHNDAECRSLGESRLTEYENSKGRLQLCEHKLIECHGEP